MKTPSNEKEIEQILYDALHQKQRKVDVATVVLVIVAIATIISFSVGQHGLIALVLN